MSRLIETDLKLAVQPEQAEGETTTPFAPKNGVVLRAAGREKSGVSCHGEHTLADVVNRGEFLCRLTKVCERSDNSESEQHALLYLDLDQFKTINQTCGYATGDVMLGELGRLIVMEVRRSDTVSYLGGDEYAVLLENCPTSEAVRVASLIRRTIEAFRFLADTIPMQTSVSIGIASITSTACDPDRSLRTAEAACWLAKKEGRNRIRVHGEAEKGHAQRRDGVNWAARLQNALTDNQFRLYQQSIFPISSGNQLAEHREILLRLADDNGALITPARFLPAAERFNLMPTLDRWVVHNTFAYVSEYCRTSGGVQHGVWSINLSALSLCKEFQQFVEEQFRANHLAPEHICFEITETAAIEKLDAVVQFMDRLRDIGCLFAIDDLGSGLTSFALLRQLPVDFIKIDGRFVKGALSDAVDRIMVEAINDIGHVMGMETIAERVEDSGALAWLQELGVDYAQGSALEKPQPMLWHYGG